MDNSQDLTRKTEGRAIRKVMAGVGKITQGRVAEKINCANSKDNYGLKFITKFITNNVLACLISLQLSKHIPCTYRTYSTADMYIRWLETVSRTSIWMGRFNHSFSVDARIMVSNHYSIIGKHVITFAT